ncbi:MAG: hypothetical protein K2G77_03045 [Muribaculaceae bacterium]|nr:hypothetical protein [Muribaculaceae bacterium]
MYQTPTISDRIVSLGIRSYRQHLEALSGIELTNQKLARLNKDLDDLYEVLYEWFNTITEAEVRGLSPLLRELLKTIKALYSNFRKSAKRISIEEEISKLGMNYSALQEIYDDMQNYRIPSEENNELRNMLKQASFLSHRIS